MVFCSFRTAYTQNQSQYSIVGTWISDPGGLAKWIFTSDGKTKTYYKGELNDTFTYSISRSPIHCGYDVSDRLEKYPHESILTLTNIQTNKKRCYYCNFDDENLILNYFANSDFLHFKKQK